MRLALPHAIPSINDRDANNGSPFIAATMLCAFRVARLIDVKASIKRLDGDNNVHELQAVRDLAAQVDQTIAGVTGRNSGYQKPFH